ncbi:dihydroxyacetone kinase [Lentzea aerocolonigenes]|uniref:phosphoenolpyruvate--glycerone phosphotransferase n=1 Tax=Lentzea aerocolonigenes TaxID=68170 RepID=A0A0F0GY66_LENAE|nr:dihydroxyacetone kinase subunit DhaK [Lentzea aerocolonigenes]KJK47506.1 dihydroxyacetone kinase [Lentzea aerocolonigenes]
MKKIINDPETVVQDALRGMQAAHPDLLSVHYDPAVVVRADAPAQGKVAIISGGGSGHEPLHGGFVGRGMLDAACPGAVFTSPTPDQVASAVSLTDGGAGALLIVKNYTGDVMNFEMAGEIADSEVRSVVIDDDVAVQDSLYTAGRRGVGGTVLLEKIVGAAADRGDSLDACVALAERVIASVRSMGLALTACTVPHVGTPSFELADDEMEIGIGIHGEPGRQRVPVGTASEMVSALLDPILEDLPFSSGDRVLLFTNGMGGTPLIELYLAHGIAEQLLADRGIMVERRLVGPFITSLEMQGMSLTLLKLDDEMVSLWDAPVHTPALRWGV